jgi:predicted O-methyltransferase YrrM
MKKTGMKRGAFDLTMLSPLRAPALYVLIRLTAPEVVVETGVADGFSSSFILQALEKNGKGKLYSIDLPGQPGQELHGKKTGWLVPDELRVRWDLRLGSSREHLPGLLRELGKVDLFYHDSDHSYENMTFEFRSVIGSLEHGGLVISDDITDSSAFEDFCKEGRYSFIRLFKFGVMRSGI